MRPMPTRRLWTGSLVAMPASRASPPLCGRLSSVEERPRRPVLAPLARRRCVSAALPPTLVRGSKVWKIPLLHFPLCPLALLRHTTYRAFAFRRILLPHMSGLTYDELHGAQRSEVHVRWSYDRIWRRKRSGTAANPPRVVESPSTHSPSLSPPSVRRSNSPSFRRPFH